MNLSSNCVPSCDQNVQNRGQNALQRRALQLKRWHESVQNESNHVTNRTASDPKVKFSAATLFLVAVAQNDIQECERLLRTTPSLDVNVTTGDGLTALHQMAIDDNLEMCGWLLNHNANCNCKDNEGWTPLHASASCGHLEVVRLLLSRQECDVFAINCDGELARDVCDGELCLALIEERMKTDLKTTIDLDVLCGDDTDDGIPETLLTEMRRKELSQIESDFEAFVLQNPVLSPPVVTEWIERTRDPISRATVLHVCAAKGYGECLARILDAIGSHLDVDSVVDCDGFTALHASAFWQQMTTFETLLSFGANFELKTRDSREVRDLCHENPKIVELMSETKKLREMAEKERTEKTISSETQRRLNAKKQRETRRPTQGVTKEDIELALKSTANALTTTNDTDDSLNTSPPPMPSSPPPTTTTTTTPTVTTSAQPLAEQNGVSAPVYPVRRRPKRRSTGIEENLNLVDIADSSATTPTTPPSVVVSSDGKDCVDSHKTIFSTTSGTTPQSRSRSSSRSSVQTTGDDSESDVKERERETERDYKKLYKELLKENEFLIKKIKEMETQRKSEKELQDFQREKRQLLRRIGELEEEVKTREELLKDNLRLKDENSALIRVISKLSK